MRVPFALRMAWRDTRGSRRRLTLTVFAVSLGVAALVAVDSFRANVTASVRGEARALLGADVALRSRTPFPDSVEAILDSLTRGGTPVARVTSFASMVLAPRSGHARLFQVRAVAGGFPFYGAVATDPPGRWPPPDDARHALVDPAVLVHLDARVGDTLAVGDARFTVTGVVTNAPGDVGLRTALGPRIFLPARYLEETNLLRFGSSAQYRAYLRLPHDPSLQRFLNRNNALFQRHRISTETASEEEEDLTDALGRLARYLGLVGLVALLLGGLGVGSAVRVFVRERLDAAALLRCLGAPTRTVLATYLLQAVALGALGAAAGVVLGLGAQALLPLAVRDFLPLEVSLSLSWSSIAAGFGIGAGTAVLFALPPLLELRTVAPLRALRRDYEEVREVGGGWRRLWSASPIPTLAAHVALAAAVVALALWQAPEREEGLAFAAAVMVTALLLRLTAMGLMRAARRWFPVRASYVVRQGIANLFRPQNQTPAVVLAIGFGVFLVATVYVAQRNLLDQLAVDTRPDRPNVVLFDVQVDQRGGVERLLADRGVRPVDVTPIVPARITHINGGVPRSDSAARAPARWALRREYRNTYRDTLVESERLVAGSWWRAGDRAPGPPRISVERELALELGVGIGDRITWDVQGAPVETRIASLRGVTWARFQPNFFVVFEPGVLEEAPQTYVLLARVADATRRAELQRDVAAAHSNVAVLDLAQVQDALDGVLRRVALAIRFMAAFSIGSGLLILVGALRASRLQRLREAVLLKTLGATGGQVRRILLTEYLAWGSLAALTGVLLAGVAGWALARWFFEVEFRLPALALAGVWAAVCALTAAVGFATGAEVGRSAPLAVLRELSE